MSYQAYQECKRKRWEERERTRQADAEKAEQLRQEWLDETHVTGENVPEGKVRVSGQVLAVKWQVTQFDKRLCMLVQDYNGFRVWGTRPASSGFWRRDHVTFTAHLSASHGDAKFGYFKYPSGCQTLRKYHENPVRRRTKCN